MNYYIYTEWIVLYFFQNPKIGSSQLYSKEKNHNMNKADRIVCYMSSSKTEDSKQLLSFSMESSLFIYTNDTHVFFFVNHNQVIGKRES